MYRKIRNDLVLKQDSYHLKYLTISDGPLDKLPSTTFWQILEYCSFGCYGISG